MSSSPKAKMIIPNLFQNVDIILFFFQFLPFAEVRQIMFNYFKENKFNKKNKQHKKLREYYQKFDLNYNIRRARDDNVFSWVGLIFKFHRSETINYIDISCDDTYLNVREIDFEKFYSQFAAVNGHINSDEFDMDEDSINLFIDYYVKRNSTSYLYRLARFMRTTDLPNDIFTGFWKRLISRSILYEFINQLKESKIYPVDQKIKFMTPEDLKSLRYAIQENLIVKFTDLQTNIGKMIDRSSI